MPETGATGRAAARRAASGRRARVRRRRGAGLLALAAGAAILAAVLSAGGGSHARARSSGAASSWQGSAGTRGAPAHGGAALRGYPESPAVRSLIAMGRPIYCGAPRGDEVALTFDDGPGTYTRLMLAKLSKHRVRATFFVVGRNIPLLAGATRQERALGAVGDHTFTHPLLTALAPGEAEREMVSTQAALARSSGGRVFLFRPPYGGRDATVDQIARVHGMLEILWTVDSADSLGADYAQIERNVIGGLRPGAIILMHENHGQTVRAMLAIFAALQRKHLRAVSVPQLLTDDPPSAAQVRAGGGGCGHGRHFSLSGA
jgi:peptidoglycan/xylan/chitin deacetylase (PgdA/CDA1 family)